MSALASKVEDRFGNYVTYSYGNTWNQPIRPTQILGGGTDGRRITMAYTGNELTSVSDGTRTWHYAYQNASFGRRTLYQVTLPDASKWSINFGAFT